MDEGGRQDALLLAPAPSSRRVSVPGVSDPVARVLLESSVAHLDRLFDYLVPAELAQQARPGTRVAVRLGGREVFGWVWERASTTTHAAHLAPVRRVISDLVVVPQATRRLVEAVARRSAGTRADVVRLAVPSRHARAERTEREREPGPWPSHEVSVGGWQAYAGGRELIEALAAGGTPRVAWDALPARAGLVEDWVVLAWRAVAACLASGRGALVVVATTGLAERVAQRLEELLGGEPVAVLSAEHGPGRRYRAFTAILTGHVRVVVGTRAAAYAPVRDLGLALMWDDADSRLDEPRAPYVHARTVLALRSSLEGAGLVLAGWMRSVEAHSYVRHGWAGQVRAPRALVRQVVARVQVPGAPELEAEGASGRARIPSLAHRVVREALREGPVLVQVPRAGYAPAVACVRCRQVVRCPHCAGPVMLGRDGVLTCRWCGRSLVGWRCQQCGAGQVRMVSVGSVRTGEELGRAFPGVPVVVSGAREDHGVIEQVDAAARLVVATPGAEPRAEGGYRAVLLLDGGAVSSRGDLGASVGALRAWASAVVLARAQARVVLLGGPDPVAAQALVRWDGAGLAARELAEREELGLPPAWRCARLDGPVRAVEGVSALARARGWQVLGPVPVDPAGREGAGGVRALIRVPYDQGGELSDWLAVRLRERSARRDEPVRVELDPTVLW